MHFKQQQLWSNGSMISATSNQDLLNYGSTKNWLKNTATKNATKFLKFG